MEPAVASQQSISVDERVRANEEVGDDPITWSTTTAIVAPGRSGPCSGSDIDRDVSDRYRTEGDAGRMFVWKGRHRFGPDDVACDHPALSKTATKRGQ